MSWVLTIKEDRLGINVPRAEVGYLRQLEDGATIDVFYKDTFVPVFKTSTIQSAIELCNYLNGGTGDSDKSLDLLGKGIASFLELPDFVVHKHDDETNEVNE